MISRRLQTQVFSFLFVGWPTVSAASGGGDSRASRSCPQSFIFISRPGALKSLV